ncbi:neurotrophin 1-like [Tachypleus tridentatus]|uniref:neurotrophin 1-like n=1 Tax=Tachypleus tridentatus TaxID=6853 RepID=UPI003FD10744
MRIAVVLVILYAVVADPIGYGDAGGHSIVYVQKHQPVRQKYVHYEESPAYVGHKQSYGYLPAYGVHQQLYGYSPAYGDYGDYGQAGYQPAAYDGYQPAAHDGYLEVPSCASDEAATYCLEDKDYPAYEIKAAIHDHHYDFIPLYADVAAQSTADSVDRLETLPEETYLCPSNTVYARPLRAKNTDGKWRIIVNVKKYTQTARIETCTKPNTPCPVVPHCYQSTCVQKNIYHRFLVFDPYDHYYPFKIESFRLPASCACLVGAYVIDH